MNRTLGAGPQAVECESTAAGISVTTPDADTVDLTGSTPDDLLIVIPYVVGAELPTH